MAPTDPSHELQHYNIGGKVRALRLRRKLGLVELGQKTGLSSAMLSKIERSRLFPTLPTLLKIARAFGVGLDHFFVDQATARPPAIVRRVERHRQPEPGASPPAYFYEALITTGDRKIDAYYAEFAPLEAGVAAAHTHRGAEMVYVTQGTLLIRLDEQEHTLETGDTIYFDAGRPHAYRRDGDIRCTAVVVTIDAV